MSLFEKSGKARFSAQSDSGDSGRHNNPLGVVAGLSELSFASGQSHAQGARLEQPEDFEDDHDNDNHSNYVKDISVHGGHSYQIAWPKVKIYPKLVGHPSKIA